MRAMKALVGVTLKRCVEVMVVCNSDYCMPVEDSRTCCTGGCLL
jgi:hypothetical protein